MFLEGLNIPGFDDNSSNSAQESSPDEESNDFFWKIFLQQINRIK